VCIMVVFVHCVLLSGDDDDVDDEFLLVHTKSAFVIALDRNNVRSFVNNSMFSFILFRCLSCRQFRRPTSGQYNMTSTRGSS